MGGPLRDNLQPTDFADADCRVTPWVDFNDYGYSAYRVWECRCGAYWFQRHEWAKDGANSTKLEDWIFSGYSPRRVFDAHFGHAPVEI